ncbi:MAG: hypothetical protein J6D06_08720 [Clostridia bacterium]|nr:hypothetical protein [Clostridia bacterium]
MFNFFLLASAFSGIQFTTENIKEALLCSVAGMVGIFIVVGIIILSVSILNKAGTGKKKDDK